MTRKHHTPTANPRDSGLFRVVTMVQVAPNRFRVTTESKRYGRITQEVVIFPDSFFPEEESSPKREGYFTELNHT
jgi:hypothetical protein